MTRRLRPADGLSSLYEELAGPLGAPLRQPPAHITLYTRPGGESIGIHDDDELGRLTRPLAGREADELREAFSAMNDVL